MKKTVIQLLFLLAGTACFSQTILGKWKTIDDETGEAKSIVEIYEYNGEVHGKIIQLFRKPEEDQDPVCDKCSDDRKNIKIVGMQIIRNMKLKDGYYQGGTILDPKNGKVYKCELWLSGSDTNKLELRGYWGWFYRTQTWIRMS
jgi:uncharacterized protein (DUF2147 family)